MRWNRLTSNVSKVPSPVNPAKIYYEFNVLQANSIDFGIKDADMSMIAMRTVKSREAIHVTLTLNLKRKELDIQFPLKTGQRTSNYRFLLPISLLSHVYKVSDLEAGETNLIIPFDSPPKFFVQKMEGEELGHGRKHTSFSTNERWWNDWETWYRETDVIEHAARRHLNGLPLMNHKGTAIIDIGEWLIVMHTTEN